MILDLNGTILDDLMAVAIPCMKNIFRTLNLQPPTEHQYRNEICADFMAFYKRHKVPFWVTKEQLNSLRELWYLQRTNELHFRPGLKGMLARLRLRGLKFAICSAELTAVMDTLIEREHLQEFFEAGLIRSQAWPKTGVLQEILVATGVSALHAVYVDDTVDGINAAAGLGIQTVGFAHPTGYNEASRIYAAKPGETVHDLAHLEAVLS